jgi:hypothetical protein
MTDERLQRQLPEILDELALPAVPDYIDDILGQTATLRQRPGWTYPERWLPMDITVQAPVGLRQVPWRAIGIASLLVLMLALAAVLIGSQLTRPAPLFGPAANGQIVFEHGGDLFVADADGRNARVLIGGETNDFYPLFARDGRTLFFGRTVEGGTAVMAADPDGTDIRRVSDAVIGDSESVVLSPDGSKLGLIAFTNGVPRLNLLDLIAGGQLRIVDTGTIRPVRYVAWRPPDARELIFEGQPDGDVLSLGIYAIRLDGTGLRQIGLQEGESPPEDNSPTQISFQNLALSDDGSKAAYWNWETEVVPGESCSTHVVDLDSGLDRRLELKPAKGCGVRPTFLGSDRILLRAGHEGAQNSQMLVADLATGNGSFVGPAYNWEEEIGWLLSPSQQQVVLQVTYGSWLVPLTTGDATRLDVSLPEGSTWRRLAP